jgi:carotenoid cleavage dioxygenase-like enzyme
MNFFNGIKYFSKVLEWRPQEKNRFIIVEKNSGKVLKTEFISAESFYFMHIINCYEENNQVRPINNFP